MKWHSEGGGPWGTGPRGGGGGSGSGGGSGGGGSGGGGSGGGGSGGGGSGGGGPWGGGGNGQGPGGPRSPRGQQPPNLEEILRRSQDRFRRAMPGGFGTGTGIIIVAVVLLVLWAASGIYRVLPDEVGVVLRFGAYNRLTPPGLRYHWPTPIESVQLPTVTRINRIEIGYRSAESRTISSRLSEESLMLTGDENIVDINFTVLWRIKDPRAYLFNIRSPEATIKSAAESAMREIVGQTPIAQALAEGRGKIESDTQTLLQKILDSYGAGIEITQIQLAKVDPPAEVIDAFRDVQRALADRETARNQAEAYRNDILPRARGDAVRIRQEAEAYRAEIVARSQGDADRFSEVYKAYKVAQDVTLERLYLETMEEILKNSNKIIIDKAAEGQSGVLPYLPLPNLLGNAPSSQSPPAGTPLGATPSGTGASPPASDSLSNVGRRP